jgi:O-antigen/teichoic acid export membrane protein
MSRSQGQIVQGTKMLKNFVKDMAAYLPSRLLPALTAFITTPILTRLFPPTEYGNWALALGISEFLVALACSGFGSAAIRFFPAYKTRSELGVFFATLSVSVGMVIAAVGVVSFSVLSVLRGRLSAALYPLLPISILIFIVQALFTLFMAVVRAQERSRLYTAFQLLFNYGSLGVGLLLVVVFGLRVEGLLWGTFLAVLLALPCLLLLTIKGVIVRPTHFRLPVALQIWRYAWPLALGNVALWGLRLSDRYIISFFRPGSEVGLYSVAYNISGKSIDMLVALFLLSVSPMVMNIWESQGREATERALTMATRLYLILCVPAVAGVSVLAFPLVALLTAEAYHEGYRIVGYVALSSFAWGLSHIAHMGIAVKKKARRLGVNQIIAALVNLGLNLVLVPRFGFIAAALTAIVGYVTLFVLQAHASRPYLTWRFPFRTLRDVIVATMCMAVAVWATYGMSGNRREVHPAYLLLSVVVAVPVYFACLWWLGETNEEKKTMARYLWHRVTGNDARAVRERRQ